MTPTFSIVVPIYNRPEEAEELLASLALQTIKDFELVLVEDGSKQDCAHVVAKYQEVLTIGYFRKENSGAGPSRNYGIERATGEYIVFFDSDCIIPPHYFETAQAVLAEERIDYWGGPDRAHPDFNSLQKAISFSMTSWLTTGGIRGTRKNKVFNPRTFNMGIRKEVMAKLGGFLPFWPGEDLELAIRARRQGYQIKLIPQAYVYHKRRTSYRKFYKQVRNFGRMRIHVWDISGEGLKLIHFLPAAYTVYTLVMWILALFVFPYGLIPGALWLLYNAVLWVESTTKNGLRVGLRSIITTQYMMFGYGFGLLGALWKRKIRGKPVVTPPRQ